MPNDYTYTVTYITGTFETDFATAYPSATPSTGETAVYQTEDGTTVYGYYTYISPLWNKQVEPFTPTDLTVGLATTFRATINSNFDLVGDQADTVADNIEKLNQNLNTLAFTGKATDVVTDDDHHFITAANKELFGKRMYYTATMPSSGDPGIIQYESTSAQEYTDETEIIKNLVWSGYTRPTKTSDLQNDSGFFVGSSYEAPTILKAENCPITATTQLYLLEEQSVTCETASGTHYMGTITYSEMPAVESGLPYIVTFDGTESNIEATTDDDNNIVLGDTSFVTSNFYIVLKASGGELHVPASGTHTIIIQNLLRFEATVLLAGCTSDMMGELVFSQTLAGVGDYSQTCETITNGIKFWAKVNPSLNATTIPLAMAYTPNKLLISFKIDSTSYQALSLSSGTTWSDWVASDYNTASAEIDANNYIVIDSKFVAYTESSVTTKMVSTDTIVPNQEYELVTA